MSTAAFKNRVLILVAPGFEETATIYCLTQLREASLQVSLVSLASGPVTGWHGLSVLPDLALDQVEDYEALKLVVIPGGRQCATMLLTDPRVHRLLITLIAQEGWVGVMKTAVPVITQSGLLTPSRESHFIIQKGDDLETFTTHLVHLMLTRFSAFHPGQE